MNMIHDAQLADHSTMRLGGTAKYLLDIHDKAELVEALAWARERQLTVMMIGGGSNIVWRDEGFDGLLLINKIMGYDDSTDASGHHDLTIGAGENWDSVVERAAKAGLTGIECLSLIPGSAGATPVQNVGAYGQEIADTLISVEAYDIESSQFVTIAASDCQFGYRTSRFKTSDRGRFLITDLKLHLKSGQLAPPFYNSLQHYLEDNNINDFSPMSIRQAVVAIRQSKLPDPAVVANCGSFFANPIVDQLEYGKLAKTYPDAPHWPAGDGKIKLSAAWLVDQAGFKDCHDEPTGMATWSRQPLVLVNEHAQNTEDLLAFKKYIVDTVQAKFGVTLVQEPELLP